MNKKEQKEWEEYLLLCEQTKQATKSSKKETATQRTKRINKLKGNFEEFCKYYFGHLMSSEFGWFHKKAAKKIEENPNGIFALEWAREHAKSVFAGIFVPMYLKARGEVTGFIMASINYDKAKKLLKDLQVQLSSNTKYIEDFGEQVQFGDWRGGSFSTKDGLGFWAFGRGQSPRGVRHGANRPNLCVVDDIDDKDIVRNLQRVQDAHDWVWEGLYPALSTAGSRMIFAQNRHHPKGIFAHLVGDIDSNTPKRKGIIHIKVYAIEDQYHRKSWFGQKGARPAWKERYTLKMLKQKFEPMTNKSIQGEYFHHYIPRDSVFKRAWIQYTKRLAKYDHIVSYCDPSFKHTKHSDYKAIVVLGIVPDTKDIHLLDIWVRKASIRKMVKQHYQYYEKYDTHARYYIEANMLQSLFLDDFHAYAKEVGYHIPIQKDDRKKPDKASRIAGLEPLFENGKFYICDDLKDNRDLQTFLEQLLEFPHHQHDDAPDALEGGIFKINRLSASSNFRPRLGRYKKRRR